MFVYKIWNYDLNHYEYYNDGCEVVELRTKAEAKRYIETYKGNFCVDLFNYETGEVTKEIL